MKGRPFWNRRGSPALGSDPAGCPGEEGGRDEQPIKIAHVSTIDMALRYLLLNQMLSIKQVGYDVYGIASGGPNTPVVEAAGVPTIDIPMTRSLNTPLADLKAFWQLYRVMRRERFTIVHTHTPKAALLAQYAALLARVPIRLHTIHGLYFPGNMKPQQRWLYVWLERLTMLFSQLNLSQNPEDIPVAIEERISRPDRIRLIGNGIDLSNFNPGAYSAEKRLALRESLGLRPEHRVVGMVARFVAEKGYLELLKAAQIIKEQMPAARFILIGPVEEGKPDALRPNIIGEMGLDDVVLFLGHRDDVADLYAVMDVLALPSHREGFPRAPMEAAAMGVPAVVTDIRGCRQTVTDGETGSIVPVRNPESLARALLDLLQHDEKRERFGVAARQKALEEFDERVVFGHVIEAYEELLSRAGLPAPSLSAQRAPSANR